MYSLRVVPLRPNEGDRQQYALTISDVQGYRFMFSYLRAKLNLHSTF
jgi:hypothetical protein